MTAKLQEGGEVVSQTGSSNNVSSTTSDGSKMVDPISFKGETHNAMFKLIQAVETVPRSRITGIGPDYLLVEFTTKSNKTTDDMEFRVDPGLKLIHLKSFSKEGETDLAENLRRVDEIKQVFESL